MVRQDVEAATTISSETGKDANVTTQLLIVTGIGVVGALVSLVLIGLTMRKKEPIGTWLVASGLSLVVACIGLLGLQREANRCEPERSAKGRPASDAGAREHHECRARGRLGR